MSQYTNDESLGPTEAVLVSEIIPATRERIYAAWLDSDQHSAFTGDEARITPEVGGAFTTLSGYARGNTVSLEPFRRIVQKWRCDDFPASSADSIVEVTLEETVGGTLLTLLHTEIPAGQSDRMRDAWLRDYLEPLRKFFKGRLSNGVHPADTKALGARARRKAKPAPRKPSSPARAAKAAPPSGKRTARRSAAKPKKARKGATAARGASRRAAATTPKPRPARKTPRKAAVSKPAKRPRGRSTQRRRR